jgi:uncharacterized membrane protein YkvA (DUF1232 family)
MVVLKILGTALLTFLYTVSPIDALPDIIPIIGWGDDVAVIVWAWTTVSQLLAEPAAA